MQLWTIQSLAVWEILQRDKVLRCTRQHVIDSWWPEAVESIFRSYDWLREQMIERIGPPPEPDIYPMWAYFQYWDAKQRRPDLRRIRCQYPRGEQHFQLELEVDEKRVLLSDHGDWNYVLSDYYFPSNEGGLEEFEDAGHPEEVTRMMKLESWQKCLDMDFHAPDISSPRDEKRIQATFWELRLEDVVGVRQFEGSGNPAIFGKS
ncbi:hypothetical protein IAD21_02275 [Abditibacteriota bacterium]|nr:hypothetical protein IAD21_02275 [Abditibacteriota bacterium]